MDLEIVVSYTHLLANSIFVSPKQPAYGSVYKCWSVENRPFHNIVICGPSKFCVLFGAIVNIRASSSNFASLTMSFVSKSSSFSNYQMPSAIYLPLKYT